jgi:glycosyltransferase involved in cell wall biosynthesis
MIKVAVLYRVIQHWRAPMFKRISDIEDLDLIVYYGADFEGTKVVSGKDFNFKTKKLHTIKITGKAGSTNGRQMPYCPFLFFQLIKDRPDVILTEGASNFANAMQGFLYARLFRKKFIWWGLGRLRDKFYEKSRKNDFINRIERKCDAQLCYSSYAKEYYNYIGIPDEKIFVAVNVVDTDRIAARTASEHFKNAKSIRHPFTVLFVGALEPNKKVDTLIKAFGKFVEKRSDAQLDIVGKGSSYDSLKQLKEELNIKNVTFHGQVIEGLETYYAKADVFVLPGLGGLAISEAMAYGLPVIASVGDGCEVDLIKNGENGFRNPELDEDDIVNYLCQMYDNPDLLEGMKKKSLEIIEQEHNVHTYINAISQAIHYVYNS